MPIPLRYSLGPFGLDPSLADPDAAVAIAPKPESVVEDESYSKSQNNPLVFDPAQRRYIRAYDPQAEAIGFVPPATPRTQTTPMAPPARSFAPTPEQLDQQRDRWFAQVSPMAAMGNRRAQAAIEAADRAMIREKVAQGMDYARALMETRMHSGLPITMAEESLARQLSPKPPVEKVDLDGTTAWRIGNSLRFPPAKKEPEVLGKLQRERDVLLKESKDADEKRKVEITSQIQGIQDRINSMTGISPGVAVPHVTPGKPGWLGTRFGGTPATTNWVSGKTVTTIPSTPQPSTPAKPLPKTQKELVKGEVYQTRRGLARWNGSAFEGL